MKRYKFTTIRPTSESEIEECDECGRPLDENHVLRNMYCESCECDLGYEVCAEDHMADYCDSCK